MAKKAADLIGLKKAFLDFYNGIKSIFVKRTDCIVGTSAPTNSTVADYVGQMYKYNGQIYVCTDIQGEETKTYTWSIGGVGTAFTKSSNDNSSKSGIVKATDFGTQGITIERDGILKLSENAGRTRQRYPYHTYAIHSRNYDNAVKWAMTEIGEITYGGVTYTVPAWTSEEQIGAKKRIGLPPEVVRYTSENATDESLSISISALPLREYNINTSGIDNLVLTFLTDAVNSPTSDTTERSFTYALTIKTGANIPNITIGGDAISWKDDDCLFEALEPWTEYKVIFSSHDRAIWEVMGAVEQPA